MKTKDIAKDYDLDKKEFETFICDNYKISPKLFGDIIVDDDKIEEYVESFKQFKEAEEEAFRIKREEEAAIQEEIENERLLKKKVMSEMLITSGFNFDGYTITRYSGYISGNKAVSVDRGFAVFGGKGIKVHEKLMQSIDSLRRDALRELKESAYELGCNAVIGVNFDYLTLDPHTKNLKGETTYQPYVFGVTANGNAVIIEKIED